MTNPIATSVTFNRLVGETHTFAGGARTLSCETQVRVDLDNDGDVVKRASEGLVITVEDKGFETSHSIVLETAEEVEALRSLLTTLSVDFRIPRLPREQAEAPADEAAQVPA